MPNLFKRFPFLFPNFFFIRVERNGLGTLSGDRVSVNRSCLQFGKKFV